MAIRYWVGGSGTWDSSSTTHWSTASGGSSGASAPTSADTVIVDSASGGLNDEITVSGTVNCLTLNMTYMVLRSTGTTSVLKMAGGGNLTGRYSGTVWSGETHIEGDTSVYSTATPGVTRIFAGATLFVSVNMNFNQVYLNEGSFKITSGAFSAGFSSFTIVNNALPKLIQMITGSSLAGTTFTNEDTANTTITQSGTAYIAAVNFFGGGDTYLNVQAQNFYGANSINQLTCINTPVQFQAGVTQTITGSLVIPINTSIKSTSAGSQATLSLAGSATYNKLTIQDISVSPTQYAKGSVNNGNNTGWSFIYAGNNLFFGSNF